MDLQYTRSHYRIPAESVPVGIFDRITPTHIEVVVDVTIRTNVVRNMVVISTERRAKLEFVISSINHPVGTGIPINADVTTRLQKIHTADAEVRRAPPAGIPIHTVVDVDATIRANVVRTEAAVDAEVRRAKVEIFLA